MKIQKDINGVRIVFNTKKQGKEYQRKFKNEYGYKPSLFIRGKEDQKMPYFILKPKGLIKVKEVKNERNKNTRA